VGNSSALRADTAPLGISSFTAKTIGCRISETPLDKQVARDLELPNQSIPSAVDEMSASREDRHEKSRRRDDFSGDEARNRRPRRDKSVSSDEGSYRRRDDREHRSHKSRRDRSPEDSHRRDRDDDDRSHRRRRSRDRSRSPGAERSRRAHSASRSKSPPPKKSRGPLPTQNEQFRGEVAPGAPGTEELPEKQKPNWKPTGLLAKEANTVKGTSTVLKYHEPAEARKPPAKEQWRMYVFKKKDLLDTVQLYQRSCWLAGRDQNVTDLTLEHPSISKQHAVIQFRHQTITNEYGDKSNKVKPYLIDLESANGTKLNGKLIATSRYVQLVDGDVISFGDSEREYVMMLPPP
jgi:smad nuclear-interacting protein 1